MGDGSLDGVLDELGGYAINQAREYREAGIARIKELHRRDRVWSALRVVAHLILLAYVEGPLFWGILLLAIGISGGAANSEKRHTLALEILNKDIAAEALARFKMVRDVREGRDAG